MSHGPYRLPSDPHREGVEGYRVLGGDGAPAGEVVALNRTREGLVLLVAPAREPESLVAVTLAAVAAVDDRAETIVLDPDALAGPRLERAALTAGGAAVVRAIPIELLRLVDRDGGAEQFTPARWLAALVLGVVSGVSLLVVYVAIGALGGAASWALLAVPVLLLAASGALLLRGLEGSVAAKLRLVPASLFGYTPRER